MPELPSPDSLARVARDYSYAMHPYRLEEIWREQANNRIEPSTMPTEDTDLKPVEHALEIDTSPLMSERESSTRSAKNVAINNREACSRMLAGVSVASLLAFAITKGSTDCRSYYESYHNAYSRGVEAERSDWTKWQYNSPGQYNFDESVCFGLGELVAELFCMFFAMVFSLKMLDVMSSGKPSCWTLSRIIIGIVGIGGMIALAVCFEGTFVGDLFDKTGYAIGYGTAAVVDQGNNSSSPFSTSPDFSYYSRATSDRSNPFDNDHDTSSNPVDSFSAAGRIALNSTMGAAVVVSLMLARKERLKAETMRSQNALDFVQSPNT